MIELNVFKAIADLAVGAKARRDEEHQEFLRFYRSLVETLPTMATEAFGNLNGVKVTARKAAQSWGIELTVSDYLWWKHEIEQGARFVEGVAAVQTSMLHRLSKAAEAQRLSPEERKEMLSLIDGSTT